MREVKNVKENANRPTVFTFYSRASSCSTPAFRHARSERQTKTDRIRATRADRENEPTIRGIVSRWSKYVERLVKEEGPLIDGLVTLNRLTMCVTLSRHVRRVTDWLPSPTAIDRNSSASRHYFQRQCMTRRISASASLACVRACPLLLVAPSGHLLRLAPSSLRAVTANCKRYGSSRTVDGAHLARRIGRSFALRIILGAEAIPLGEIYSTRPGTNALSCVDITARHFSHVGSSYLSSRR